MTGTLRPVLLIARREFASRVRGRAFVVGTVVVLVLLGVYAAVIATIASGDDTARVGVTGPAIALTGPLERAAPTEGLELTVVPQPDVATGEAAVRAGDLDALIGGEPARPRVYVESEPDAQTERVIVDATSSVARDGFLVARGVDPAALDAAVAESGPVIVAAEPPDPQAGQRLGLGLAGAFLLFFSIQTYGAMVAQGVVEEKASRVVEIVLSSVRPWQLLLGKVLGLGAVGLLQLVVLGGAGLAVAGAAGILVTAAGLVSTLVWVVVWYLLGFALYATVFAAAGSLVSRQEDTQSVLSPVTITVLLGFVVGFNLLTYDQRGTPITVLSLLPPFSPLFMPARIALGVAPAGQIVLALVLTIAFTAGVLALGGRIYANSVLRTGARVSLREALGRSRG
ncbi:ABC-2 type transport system permease protein [Actinomycetospora succinea]|uniref:ABC-2 type transport system permease protein n=1 Tax=Actinomycetospora succinea TaxID=663603 RepID=A0A4R6VRY1_9PSEU|nr:ABC transporter permease [Actinomycetospora succinea]TDQ62630.1 ABC-2 type transport system permease protein [Actinomycetospora succinea]